RIVEAEGGGAVLREREREAALPVGVGEHQAGRAVFEKTHPDPRDAIPVAEDELLHLGGAALAQGLLDGELQRRQPRQRGLEERQRTDRGQRPEPLLERRQAPDRGLEVTPKLAEREIREPLLEPRELVPGTL